MRRVEDEAAKEEAAEEAEVAELAAATSGAKQGDADSETTADSTT